MQFDAITRNDLEEIGNLLPEGWSDIVPDFEFYIRYPFCYPVKTKLEGKIVGVGALIVFEHTCWLAHIIVDKKYRRQGIGQNITQELMKMAAEKSIPTCLLIASDLGKPVYDKLGFITIAEYTFLKKKGPWQSDNIIENVVPFQEEDRPVIFALDRKITGENRERLLNDYLGNMLVYTMKDQVLGYYVPNLKQGPIYAETEEAGISLMKTKYPETDVAVVPSDNVAALDFLKQNGFAETGKKGTRMFYGKEIGWEPKKFYGRIGGNLG